MKDKTKKMIGIGGTVLTAAGIAGLTAISYTITNYLMRVALDRKEPKSMTKARKQLMGTKGNEELVKMLRTASDNLESKVTEEAEITAHDGIKLVGHWWPCDEPKRVIVAMHGWRSSWSQDFGVIADFWHDNGCSILFAEQRGQNKSGGEYMGFGLMERYDCRDWVDWVNDKTNAGLPVYLCGVSMGATTVLMASGLELPQNVVGIAADSAFTSPYAIWKHVVENNLHLSYGIRSASADSLCRKKINMKAKEYTTMEALKNTDIPVLFIHGTDDHFVPIEMTYENYKACASEKRLLVVPGAEHARSYIVNKNEYEDTFLKFFRDFDKKF